MFCFKCGQQLPNGSAFCTACGAAQPTPAPAPRPVYQAPAQPPYQAPAAPQYQPPVQTAYAPAPVPQNLSWKDFYSRFVSKKVKSTVVWMVVICFVTAVISIGLTAVLEGDLDPIYCIMDVAVYGLSGVLLLATKHWATVLLPTIYGAVWTVVSMANDGTPTGIVAIVVGVTCISVLQKAQKAYQAYKTTGVIPAEPI